MKGGGGTGHCFLLYDCISVTTPQVGPKLNAMGLKTYPMITTVNITSLRTLFAGVSATARGVGATGGGLAATVVHLALTADRG